MIRLPGQYCCPLKSAVWTGIWLEFFGTVPLPSVLSSALQSFVFPPMLNPAFPASSVFGLTILTIWDHHWSFYFKSVPFLPSAVLHIARKSISHLCSELELDSP
ncbi:hypothetical protein PHYBLDRAFT_147099 [Phycomyces blakesleeanus NRRL 1555(-)]|uniref:Uncharacterized protein n=1 Tax=Phycomyces blakesleeanus (strain ATCC 8743b / DSM 1359 / FGSC 10004 / NBRC 33097 / NRRL 1555) TaxID=763407 RepID=A0A167M8K8_PHYB8|nr:hypothetical protein PHYBLDRAFT_147099 [Phycomyces blakesleeanus NRRL 1555(-)]OAD72124.1 hypothetical protein PHYBLDRAFT_147099 [Phycomyces blakesleeanus NRRL 1555(-)]|eukprot:XP_018290164.1 hypothetical protein PHYBLDRAFT_147099 [Phycomyces blakesleeanus NRRL 1555(-)]